MHKLLEAADFINIELQLLYLIILNFTKSIAKEKGDVYARLSIYFKCCVIAIENEIVNDDEIENNDGC